MRNRHYCDTVILCSQNLFLTVTRYEFISEYEFYRYTKIELTEVVANQQLNATVQTSRMDSRYFSRFIVVVALCVREYHIIVQYRMYVRVMELRSLCRFNRRYWPAIAQYFVRLKYISSSPKYGTTERCISHVGYGLWITICFVLKNTAHLCRCNIITENVRFVTSNAQWLIVSSVSVQLQQYFRVLFQQPHVELVSIYGVYTVDIRVYYFVDIALFIKRIFQSTV